MGTAACEHGDHSRQERTEPKQFRFIGRLTVANTATDAKCFGVIRYVAAVQKVR